MAEIVKVDKSGRMVIPKTLREELGVGENDRLILTTVSDDRLVLQKLAVESLAKGLKEELAGKDVDAIVRTVRKETNAKIKELYPELFD